MERVVGAGECTGTLQLQYGSTVDALAATITTEALTLTRGLYTLSPPGGGYAHAHAHV